MKQQNRLNETYDLWKDDEEPTKNSHPSTKRSRKIALPHPGQSYNPDPVDHDRLLKKIAQKELAYQKKIAAIDRAVSVKVDKNEIKKDEEDELMSGIRHLVKKDENSNKKEANKSHNDDSDGSSTDEAFSDYDDKDFKAIVKDKRVIEKRKSKQQRLKQLKDHLQRKAAKLRKLKNIRASKFDQLKKLTKELDKKEKEAAKIKRKHKKIRNERLGQKFEPSDPIYCLKSELPSSLRSVKCPMDAIVREQLESFQSRLLVEPTKLQTRSRKYKKKQFERKLAAEQEG